MTPDQRGSSDPIRALLELFYESEAIYLQKIVYDAVGKTITGQFIVPSGTTYSRVAVDYVTAEQYMRCLSQLSYVLVGFLVRDGVIGKGSMNFSRFQRFMTASLLWLRRSKLHYHTHVGREVPFELTLQVVATRLLRGQFATCTLSVGGAIIRGELEFVVRMRKDV